MSFFDDDSSLCTECCFASLNKTIIFVPHDNRPISFKQTADNIRDLGYEVLTPPEELLGNREDPYAKPEELSKWVIENAKKLMQQ